MKRALLVAIVLLLVAVFVAQTTEYFTDTEFTNVKRPCLCTGQVCPTGCSVTVSTSWTSRIDALAATGYVVADYIAVLAAFYDTVYVPAATKPTEAQVDTFLASSAGTVAGVDRAAVKTILMDGFHIESSGTAASREEKSQMFKPSNANLAPSMGRDELRTRTEDGYTPADPHASTRFSEGAYAPVTQTNPINPGQWEDGSTMWKGPRPASVCPCAENIM